MSSRSASDSIQQKIAEADSSWMNRMGNPGSFVGIHTHGKDLAVHAHQDIGKQRRVIKEAARILPERRSAYQRSLERRKAYMAQLKNGDSNFTVDSQ